LHFSIGHFGNSGATGHWYLPPLLGALPLGFNFKISLKVSFKNKMNAKNIFGDKRQQA
jgi:hypothetical protein